MFDSITLSVGSKTFVLGEYLVLQQGPALLLTTEPRFNLSAHNKESNLLGSSIHPDSPAGKLITQYRLNKMFSLEFDDPHQGRGGFGASSAQFLLVYALIEYLQKKKYLSDKPLKPMHALFLELAYDNKGIPPSGADLFAQLHGGLISFSSATKKAQKQEWPFENLSLHILRTGNKIATHEHLKQLKEFDATHLDLAMKKAKTSIKEKCSTDFIDAINNYACSLKELNFVHPQSQQLINELNQLPCVLASKACGAMGADVILAITNCNDKKLFSTWCADKSLEIIASNVDSTDGILIKERSLKNVVC